MIVKKKKRDYQNFMNFFQKKYIVSQYKMKVKNVMECLDMEGYQDFGSNDCGVVSLDQYITLAQVEVCN